MRDLKPKQINEKISQFFTSYESTFGEEANHNQVAYYISQHLEQVQKDYVLGFLGDYSAGTLIKLNEELQEEAKRRNSARIEQQHQQQRELNPGITAEPSQQDTKPSPVSRGTKKAGKRKTKRKSKKRSAGSTVQNS